MNRLFKWLYRSGILKNYKNIDFPRYLRRLAKGGKLHTDAHYYSDTDYSQYSGNEVVFRGYFRQELFWFYCDVRIPLEFKLLQKGTGYNDFIWDLLSDLARPETIVLDIGGNIGLMAIPLALARPSTIIHSFEPNPHATKRFLRNLDINIKASNVKVIESAVGSECGISEFHAYSGEYLADGSFIACPRVREENQSILVNVITLDSVYLQKDTEISVIKIDAQGYESQVLHGAKGLIRRDRPFIIFEHEDMNFNDAASAASAKRDIANLFSELSYKVFYISRYNDKLLFPVNWDNPLNGELIAIP